MSWFILIWALCNLAFIALASSMSKHQKQIFGQELVASKTKLATVLGWVLLTVALIACLIHGDSVSNMISYWIGVLSFSALTVAFTLSYFESKVKALGIVSLILVILTFTLYLI
jgi:hypothetical protein